MLPSRTWIRMNKRSMLLHNLRIIILYILLFSHPSFNLILIFSQTNVMTLHKVIVASSRSTLIWMGFMRSVPILRRCLMMIWMQASRNDWIWSQMTCDTWCIVWVLLCCGHWGDGYAKWWCRCIWIYLWRMLCGTVVRSGKVHWICRGVVIIDCRCASDLSTSEIEVS